MKFRPPMTSMAVNVFCTCVLRTDQGVTTAAKPTHKTNAAANRFLKDCCQKTRTNNAKNGGDNHTTLRVNAPRPSNPPVMAKRPAVEPRRARTADQLAAVSRQVNSTSVRSRLLYTSSVG